MSSTDALPVGRPAPRARLVDPTVLRIELRRLFRNRRSMVFTFVFPAVMILFIGSQVTRQDDSLGPNAVANVGAYVMASMATYGAVVATTTTGASVSIERAAGWSRQLRLTPLRPISHVLVKVLVAVVLGVLATCVSFATGAVSGIAQVHVASLWWQMGLVIVLGALVFAAFGLFMGYLLPADNAMQMLGFVLAVLAILGGLFSGPLPTDSFYGQVARLTPIYGLSEMVHWPLTMTTDGSHAPFQASWVVNLVAWGLVFVGGAVWRFRRDTARV
jgi:ABC-2 type transport system permease protein